MLSGGGRKKLRFQQKKRGAKNGRDANFRIFSPTQARVLPPMFDTRKELLQVLLKFFRNPVEILFGIGVRKSKSFLGFAWG